MEPAEVELEEEDLNDSQQTSLIDAIEEEEKSIVERYAEDNGSQSLAEKLGKSPIEDLPKAIGLNQKFLFINELFDGDTDAYQQAIESLNSLSGMDEAQEALTQLQGSDDWGESEAAMQFRELVERRYIVAS